MRKTGATLLAAFAGGLLALGVYRLVIPENTVYQYIPTTPAPKYSEYTPPSVIPDVDFTVAAERTVNSVVHIKTITETRNSRYVDPFEEFFFGKRRNMPQMGAGSGVILTSDGYIITNNHVIEGADKIEVVLNDKRTYKGKVIGSDPNTDLAVVKINEINLPAVPIANSDDIKVGEWVLAVGNPFNLTSTVTAGIVSAKGRNIDIIQENYKIESFIQTDAVVNPGNSGGALVNINGELVGLNTAIQTHTGSFEGYAFAIPSNLVKKVAEDIIEYGSVQRGLLGVNIRDITSDFAKDKGIRQLEGVWVVAPLSGGAAAEAGIRSGDIIIGVDDVPVNSVSELQENVGLHRPGDELKITVNRNGARKDIMVTLKGKTGNTTVMDRNTEVNELLGARFETLSESELLRLDIKNGVKVKEVTSGKLRSVGVKPGFIITEVNGEKIRDLNDLSNALNNGDEYYHIGGMYASGERVYYSFN